MLDKTCPLLEFVESWAMVPQIGDLDHDTQKSSERVSTFSFIGFGGSSMCK